MKTPKILVYNSRDAELYADFLHQHGYDSIVTARNEDEAAAELPETEIVFGWKFPTSLLSTSLGSNVRWFQSMGAGVDDLMADQTIPGSVSITRVTDIFGGPIAEYVFSYLLYVVKGISRIHAAQSKQIWDPFIADTLSGKRIGVAGLGSIGAEIIRKARAFDMHVDGLSYSGKHAALVDRHFGPNDWIEFVKGIDMMVLTLPLTAETYHVINRDILMAMKRDAIIVNVGRGKLLSQPDLVDVLSSGHLQAAILDVFEEEPLPMDHPLWTLPNVVVSPHLSGPSTPQGVGQFFIHNLENYLSGKPLNGLVSRTQGY